MRHLVFGVLLVSSAALPALAADDPMTSSYGNTMVYVSPTGTESHTYYSADHTFTGVAPAYSYHYKGTWEITADGKLCRTFDPAPPGITNPDCDPEPLVPHAIGDKWTSSQGGQASLVQGVN